MTKEQLDNLIAFCFNFHETMGFNIDCTGDYIIEKWDKFIGVKPFDNESLSFKELSSYISTYKKYNGCIVGVDKEDIRIANNMIEWYIKWGTRFDYPKEILYFILLLNRRPLVVKNGDKLSSINWTPSEIIELFKEKIGDVEKINKQTYNHTHQILKLEIKNWLEETSNKRDYKLNLLV